jgi:hypothetical protein
MLNDELLENQQLATIKTRSQSFVFVITKHYSNGCSSWVSGFLPGLVAHRPLQTYTVGLCATGHGDRVLMQKTNVFRPMV